MMAVPALAFPAAQHGKQAMRPRHIAWLHPCDREGVAVCLIDWWAPFRALWMCVGAVATGCALVYKMRIGCPVYVSLCICQSAALAFCFACNLEACTSNLTAEHAAT